MATLAELTRQAMDWLRDTKRSYQLTFQMNQPANVVVLEDLARFCRANESCVVPGERDKTLVLEGRREVWLRIQQYLQLSPEQLFDLKQGLRAPKQEQSSE